MCSREELIELMKEKERIEEEIKQQTDILKSCGVGMNESLTDEDDYPRSDLDICTILSARGSIARLTNDHKMLMDKIEKGLHSYFQQEKPTMNGSSQSSERVHLPAFLHVDDVIPGSPAALAGIASGDSLLRVGSLTAHTMTVKDLTQVSEVFRAAKNMPLQVCLRDTKGLSRETVLIPRDWSGPGLTGLRLSLVD